MQTPLQTDALARFFPAKEAAGGNRLRGFGEYLYTATLNSYGMLLFSRNRVFSFLILLVSFFTPFTGACGLAALLIALIAAHGLGFSREQVRQGLVTYSVVLFGMGFGTNFEPGLAFWLLLAVGALLTLFLSVALNAILNKRGLPALSLAFIISTDLLIIASKSFEGIGLTHRHIYWYNEVYALGGNSLVNLIQQIENWPMAGYIAGFFRSMSAILFQVNIATGILLSAGLLIYSRIGFSLMILGYAVALFFNQAMGGFNHDDMTYYNMGTNFMLVALALGGFYCIPTLRSYLWILVTVPLAHLLVVGLGSLTFSMGAPVFSLPFCIVVILFLFVLQLRKTQHGLILTPVQYYSPEQNLYRYLNGKSRLQSQYYVHLFLPFMGEWMVSQGHDGTMTHKGDWSKAWDFVILDHEMKTYANPGNLPEHFYCFNKPVLAPADGIVQEIADHVDDNEIGGNNTGQNWGNSIVIRHTDGLYTKLSHLRKNSFRVSKGDFVKRGDWIAACGNSGRSPEPHLHFQVQSTPYVGSRTLRYPLAYFKSRKDSSAELKQFSAPAEGCFVSNLTPDFQLQQAFRFQPGCCMTVKNGDSTEEWESLTSYYNETYLYCRQQNAYAYFVYNGSLFYFTNYFGPKNTLLYQFYLAAYTVPLCSDRGITIRDQYPVNVFGQNPLKWLQDLVAPFYRFISLDFSGKVESEQDALGSGQVTYRSVSVKRLIKQQITVARYELLISNGSLQSVQINRGRQQTILLCSTENG